MNNGNKAAGVPSPTTLYPLKMTPSNASTKNWRDFGKNLKAAAKDTESNPIIKTFKADKTDEDLKKRMKINLFGDFKHCHHQGGRGRGLTSKSDIHFFFYIKT